MEPETPYSRWINRDMFLFICVSFWLKWDI